MPDPRDAYAEGVGLVRYLTSIEPENAMRDAAAMPDHPDARPPVAAALGDLRDALDRVDHQAHRLGEKLAPVLDPEAPGAALLQADAKPRSELTATLADLARRANAAADTLATLVARCEL
jgi:hypothetical protein